MLTRAFRTGDPVVLVDRHGLLMRDLRQRPMRGVIVRRTLFREYEVSLGRTGRHRDDAGGQLAFTDLLGEAQPRMRRRR